MRIDGKLFARNSERFRFHGVTYGTFRPRAVDGARFPGPDRVAADFEAMAAAGFTVVRCYTSPPEDVLQAADANGLLVLAEAFFSDWRYLTGWSRRLHARVRREALSQVRREARRLAGDPRVFALSVGNEIPADVVRWVGTRRAAQMIDDLVETVREEDPDRLVTYANYPTAEYLPLPSVDFLTFNVFLEQQQDFRAYLTRLQHLAGDRPLVLGEVGLDAGSSPASEARQASTLDWQLETALERGVAGACVYAWTDEWCVGENEITEWHFGITRRDRSPRPALRVAERWNARTVGDIEFDWPSISVIICAHNAEGTLEECLRHVEALRYGDVETIVVNDGSTDQTAAIARRHDVRLVDIEHSGLAAARNAGIAASRGELVAFLDSDAYPSPEWLHYLALGLDSGRVGGVGGPNVPPPDDPRGAQVVARAPGGPVHVLLDDARAEHIPGCNMAFWRLVLDEVGGFDPIYTAAGDDVDVCWKVTDRDWELGFHPAALVWHHPRQGVRAYLRQQRGYGRADALVESRHPQRFTSLGTARWSGRIYDSFAPRPLRQRIYRGVFGTAPFQAVYAARGDGRALLRQVGVPVAAAIVPTAVLGVLSVAFALPALVAALLLATMFLGEAVSVRPPEKMPDPWSFRLQVAWLSVLQPLARLSGYARHQLGPNPPPHEPPLPDPIGRARRGTLVFGEDRPREQFVSSVIFALRVRGLRAFPSFGWDDYDASMNGSTLVRGQLVSASHPPGCVQVRVRRRLRLWSALIYAVAFAVALQQIPAVAVAVAAIAGFEIARGTWRTGRVVRRALAGQGSPEEVFELAPPEPAAPSRTSVRRARGEDRSAERPQSVDRETTPA